MDTLEVRSGYKDGGKPGALGKYRNPVDIAEMVSHCDCNSHIWFLDIHGQARQAKVNGKVRTWKRDKNRVEVPCKYGMYEYFTLEASDISRVLIPVSEATK